MSVAVAVSIVSALVRVISAMSECVNCLQPDWTMFAYSKHEILQVGCWRCYSIYNVVDDDDYRITNQNPEYFIFWKDLVRQWNEMMTERASSAKP